MAQMTVRAAERGDRQVLADARRCIFMFCRFCGRSSALGTVVK